MPAGLVDLELQRQPEVVGHRTRLQIDRKPIARMGGSAGEEVVDLCLVQADGQHTILEAVVVEDVGEAGRKKNAEAVILQRPGSMFAARSAAKIPPREQ